MSQLSIEKTDERIRKWRELKGKLSDHGMGERARSKVLDKAVDISLYFLGQRKKEIQKVKEKWEIPE